MRRESQKFSLFVFTMHIIITSINNINRSLVPPKTLIFFPQIFFFFASQEILFKSREWFLSVKGVNSIKAYLYIAEYLNLWFYSLLYQQNISLYSSFKHHSVSIQMKFISFHVIHILFFRTLTNNTFIQRVQFFRN